MTNSMSSSITVTNNYNSNASIPSRNTITKINIFDFDGTLFASPQPNRELWEDPLFGYLKADTMIFKGWYQHPKSLSFDEPVIQQGWEGWWNKKIVKLVRQSIEQPTSLTVLLTGRGYSGFRHIIAEMVERKDLKFDVMGFKPDKDIIKWNLFYNPSIIQKVGNTKYEELICHETLFEFKDNKVTTKEFKYKFINELLFHHPSVNSIHLWDDRVNHVKSFQSFFDDLKLRGIVQEATANAVYYPVRYFDPCKEFLVVQAMIDEHNSEVERFSRQQNELPRKFSLGRLQLVPKQYQYDGWIYTRYAVQLVDVPF
ncbi:4344_t:CDS:1 [Scutellospora calospora]|uniref:4344_t:CDS:1 n=1 Tax=Scutellospora calospora TaxID=85575 RepID=A0ACA9L9U8_9GLOM|nr:4344_t:CDS:1 [Scutellospora calospora]